MRLSNDLREFIELLNSHGVEYVIVGAHCLAFHARPRYTGDLDIFVRPTAENAAKLETVLRDFGFTETPLTAKDFLHADQVIQLGRAPNRIDLLTGLSGVDAAAAFETRVTGNLDGLPVFLLAKKLLVENKRATGRPQDLADLAMLEDRDSA